jgi:signal transduction histidine kinase
VVSDPAHHGESASCQSFSATALVGPEFCCIYNDAYIPILATKHPAAIGRPTAEVWHEIWDVLKPLIETPFRGGPATWAEDIELVLNRRGYREETHFTIAYSPLPDETAERGIGGVLATVHEITEKVIGERRIVALRELSVESTEAESSDDACLNAVKILAGHRKDVSFAMLYLMDSNGESARLVCSDGVNLEDPGCTPFFENVRSQSNPWPVSEMIGAEKIYFVRDISTRFATLPNSAWEEPAASAALVPIHSNIAHQLAGFIIVGLSPRSQFDESYRNFLELMSTQIATSIARARAYEEERKRSQALAEIDRAKTAFFSNVSHEFRTPLTLMLGPLEELLAGNHNDLSPSARGQLDLVNRNGIRLLRLVNTLLDFSRIEAGRVQAAYRPTDLSAFTTDLASVFRSATERAGLELNIQCSPLSKLVYVDRDMWEKIVLNLISNAFKFTFEGAITVHLEQKDRSVQLQVRDTGVGIPHEEIPKLFERFHRVENTRSRTHEGSGIGLAMVNELVKLHGGSIHVDSKPGRGSTFCVDVPLGTDHLPAEQIGGDRPLASTATGADPFVEEALRWLPADSSGDGKEIPTLPELAPAPYTGPAEVGTTRPRVIVADDNADMRQYLARLLMERYDAVMAADGREVLESIRERRPDLILSDIMMPNLDGLSLMKELRSDPATSAIPIILLSARAGEEARVEGLDAGADDYLVKPFSARELLARVSARLTITQLRSAADKVLRESEENYRKLAESLDAEVRERTRELEDRNADVLHHAELLRDLSFRLMQAQDEERRHIARELHDSAGQTLVVLSMHLAQIAQESENNSPEISRKTHDAREILRQLETEIRTTSYLLHPPLLDETGLFSALDWYIEGLKHRSGLDIQLNMSEDFGRVPRDLELVIFRLVQECLTNIHRHSGATSASIRILRTAEHISVRILDNGRGMSREKLSEIQSGGHGVGLRGIRERLRQFQGELQIESENPGTSIVVTIPFPNAEAGDLMPSTELNVV